jgi:predicted N-formylglutamate amidohydrolase
MTAAVSPLLAPDEPPAFEIVNPAGRADVLLLCDHASHRLPRRLGTLGLAPGQILEHIGWDIGAALVARRLAARLDAPLVLSGYSRLVIDCNRPPGVPSSIPERTGGVPIPGNEALSDEEKTERARACFWPYHRAIEALLAARPRPAALLSMHSFTPDFPGELRPWPLALLYGHDRRLAGLLMDEIRATHGLLVGDNEPYQVSDTSDYGVPIHGERRGISSVLVEVRQDGILTPEGATLWADRLADAFLAVAPRL